MPAKLEQAAHRTYCATGLTYYISFKDRDIFQCYQWLRCIFEIKEVP